jgi:hypothetical protein
LDSRSSIDRVVICCTESVVKSTPIVNDVVMACYKGSETKYRGKSTDINEDGTFEVLFDDGDIDRLVASVAPIKSRWRRDQTAACQFQIILLKSKSDTYADVPWAVYLPGSTIGHASMYQGARLVAVHSTPRVPSRSSAPLPTPSTATRRRAARP